MPPKKRAYIGRVDPNTKRVRDQREAETSEQRRDRLEGNRARIAEARATQTLEQREESLSEARLRLAALRASESQESRSTRLEDDRARHAETRSQETAEQRESRLEDDRARHAETRSQETAEERESRLEDDRARHVEARSQETAEERESRLEDDRARHVEARSQETAEERESRLEDDRARHVEARSQETAEERESRFEDDRARHVEARSQETAEERESRLEDDRARHAEIRSQETAEERESRLEDDRARHAEARSQEAAEERESRLEDDRARHVEARSQETVEERESRLERNRARQVRTRQTSRRVDLHLAALNYDAQVDYSTHPKVQIGNMDVVCGKCQARKFRAEPPGMCCSSGKVDLPPLREPPEPLRSYMSGTSAESRHFLQNIRKYNACFQMTSFGTTVATPNAEEQGFMPTFKVQGQVYHRAGSLLPYGNNSPKFLQLYFVCDEELQANQRCSIVGGTRPNIVLELQRMLHEHNRLVRDFKTNLEKMPTDEYKVVIRADKRPAGQHERRFNAPSVSEMAVVLVDEGHDRRDIIIQKRCETLQRISETHRSYDALQYPLIFWEGEDGYHFELWQRNPSTGEFTNKKVSAMDFYAHRMMIRSTSFNHVVKSRQLFHQFIVDMYAKIENERLLFIRLNQRKLRADDYIHLRDAVAEDGNVNDLGQMVILPSSFTGGPRHMHEYTQDAMAYVRAYGRPDLFITFTCNPAWIEIAEELFPGEAPSDRHDITARVFKQKLKKLMDVLTKSHVYGDTRCWMYTVEWQKRGLPHAHILLWLKEKIRPDQIDSIISAEFPNREDDPLLFDVVLKNMIHGPCGPLNPRSPCMKDGKCTKRYPRQLIRETQTGRDGYPLYRRRKPDEGGYTAVIRMRMDHQPVDVEVDNSWVVPYTPLLSKMFKAHINVEYCNSVKSIKYICKYVNKGSDMAAFDLAHATAPFDEIERYQTGRYISSNEAVWRILGFQIHEHYPPVVHLSVHLENGERVFFTADNARQRAAQPPRTTLTAFFLLCEHDPFARTLLYSEVPKYYTWNNSTKKFARRKQGAEVPGQHGIRAADVLGRVYTVHPKHAECFYLRLLLHTIRGPTSFAALRTIDGEVCETYREACRRLGLLEDDQQWDRALAEVSETSFAAQLRSLFAIILTACTPSNPQALWEKYKEALSEDILLECRRVASSADVDYSPEIFNRALILLEDMCASMTGQTLRELGLPSPIRGDDQALESDILRERSYDVDQLSRFVESNIPLLTEDQGLAYHAVLDTISSGRGGLLFLDAPGGTGKTFVINLLLAEIRRQGGIALAVASSGIASTLLEGGRTAHSAFKLPLDIAHVEHPVCGISKGTGKAKVLQETKLIVWDECTMAHKKSLEALDTTLKDIRGSNRLMGGAVVLLAGDFRQTLPVIPRSTPADELNACLKASHLWRHVRSLNLTTNMRVHLLGDETARSFAQQLLLLGEGRVPVEPDSGMITFPPGFCNMVQSVEELIEKVFPNIATNFTNGEWICERAILAPRNEQVNSINAQILNSLPGEVTTYTSVDTTVQSEQAVHFPTEFLNSLEPNGVPPHRLDLKVGLPIMLLRNIQPPKMCNGTRVCIRKLMPNAIEGTVLAGKFKGEIVHIPKIPFIPSDMPFDFKRVQFPVRAALAMTINKAQGQSLRTVGVDLETPCFSHGQLYVACSRVGSPANLYIYAPEGSTANVVYPRALS